MKEEIINKLMKIGYTEEQSKEYYAFYESRGNALKLLTFADDVISMITEEEEQNE